MLTEKKHLSSRRGTRSIKAYGHGRVNCNTFNIAGAKITTNWNYWCFTSQFVTCTNWLERKRSTVPIATKHVDRFHKLGQIWLRQPVVVLMSLESGLRNRDSYSPCWSSFITAAELSNKKQDEAHEPECRHVCWVTETLLICQFFQQTHLWDTLTWHTEGTLL